MMQRCPQVEGGAAACAAVVMPFDQALAEYEIGRHLASGDPSKDDSLFHELVVGALARLEAELRRTAPFMAEPVGQWIRRGCDGAEPGATYLHPRSFPLLQLPYWLARTLPGEIGPRWNADLAYSSPNGFYIIPLIDNAMDGDVPGEGKRLPAAACFH